MYQETTNFSVVLPYQQNVYHLFRNSYKVLA